MATDSWDRQDTSSPDRDLDEILAELVEDINPLAKLAAELAQCISAVSCELGGFCAWCECDLKYHVPTEDGSCEICTCLEQHTKLEMPFVPSAKLATTKERPELEPADDNDRSKEARKALRELTE